MSQAALNFIEAFEKQEEFRRIPRGALELLEKYATLLLKWNKKINLISAKTEVEIYQRHIADSLQLVPKILDYNLPSSATILDIGSGAGLPGIILAVALPHFQVISVEADSRKCAFQTEAARIMGLKNFKVINKRIEQISDIKPDVITCRAFASLHNILWLTRNITTKECLHLYLKAANVKNEIKEAQEKFAFSFKLHKSITEPESFILELKGVECLAR